MQTIEDFIEEPAKDFEEPWRHSKCRICRQRQAIGQYIAFPEHRPYLFCILHKELAKKAAGY